MSEEKANLGFRYETTPTGDVRIFREGKFVTVLRKKKAQTFLVDVAKGTSAQQQQIMARLTGNYARGNERTAKDHPRNQ
ncbi:MAG TPA: hypothetical protein VK171_07605 [Fimbriimonas sp.]|nr:hypothetical protein [Fimbriimonas sp.]